jgi:hypothetical protein
MVAAMRWTAMLVVLGTGTAVAQPLEREVLVWQDARLLVGPNDKAEVVALAALAKPRARSVGMVVQMHVVAESGDFVEVTPASSTCDLWGSLVVDRRLDRLRLFVRRADLAPVVSRRWSQTFDDGTSLALVPGEPIGEREANGRTVALSLDGGSAPVELTVNIPDDSVGRSFTPTADARPDSYDEPVRWTVATRTITLAGRALAFDHALPLLTKVTYRGDRALLPYDLGCEELVASVPRSQIRAYKPDAPGGLMGSLHGDHRDLSHASAVLPAGTPLATPAGHTVAIVWEDFEVTPGGGSQICVDFQIRVERRHDAPPPTTLSLCAPSSAARAPATPPPARHQATGVTHGAVEASGGLDASVVRRVVRRYDAQLIACYDAAPVATPGTVVAKFIIGGDGRAQQVAATGIDGVAACVAGVVATMEFPKPTGPVQVTYPLAFR